MAGLDFSPRTRERSADVAPIASGRFAFLEMQDRRRLRCAQPAKKPSVAPRVATDPHRDPSPRLLEAWEPVEDSLRLAVDESTFNIWIAPLHPHALLNGTWQIACHPRAIGWISERFGRIVDACAERPVEFVICEAA